MMTSRRADMAAGSAAFEGILERAVASLQVSRWTGIEAWALGVARGPHARRVRRRGQAWSERAGHAWRQGSPAATSWQLLSARGQPGTLSPLDSGNDTRPLFPRTCRGSEAWRSYLRQLQQTILNGLVELLVASFRRLLAALSGPADGGPAPPFLEVGIGIQNNRIAWRPAMLVSADRSASGLFACEVKRAHGKGKGAGAIAECTSVGQGLVPSVHGRCPPSCCCAAQSRFKPWWHSGRTSASRSATPSSPPEVSLGRGMAERRPGGEGDVSPGAPLQHAPQVEPWLATLTGTSTSGRASRPSCAPSSADWKRSAGLALRGRPAGNRLHASGSRARAKHCRCQVPRCLGGWPGAGMEGCVIVKGLGLEARAMHLWPGQPLHRPLPNSSKRVPGKAGLGVFVWLGAVPSVLLLLKQTRPIRRTWLRMPASLRRASWRGWKLRSRSCVSCLIASRHVVLGAWGGGRLGESACRASCLRRRRACAWHIHLLSRCHAVTLSRGQQPPHPPPPPYKKN